MINDFYETLHTPFLTHSKLSGSVHALLCILLHQAYKEKILSSQNIVEIQESEDLDKDILDKDSNSKSEYYSSLGFHKVDKKIWRSDVSSLLTICRSNRSIVSKELKQILNQLQL